MKNKITAILLFFLASFAFNGLMAQTPGPVHGSKTDREIQKEDDNSQDRTYSQDETEENTRQSKGKAKSPKATQVKHGKKAKATKETCESEQKNKSVYEEGRGRKGLDHSAIKRQSKVRKADFKKKEKYFKKHPIFERRSDAWNGKGEN